MLLRTRTFFEDVTFLSLFHRPTFDAMIYGSVEPRIASALLAAMSAFSVHYMDQAQSPSEREESTSANRFYRLARSIIQDQLDRCGDSVPPLALLQAYVLTTFYEMMVSARGR